MAAAQAADRGEFANPSGVAVDSVGNVYVADYYNHRIQKLTAATGGMERVEEERRRIGQRLGRV
ncbi:SBBP repeat-containing protein [Cohnella rhizosphaerae]|uniref:SBBP repeat-containing protein n=1 Tax=Cohnella rhizosphaerae TaxID=1457232 RepID=UPI003B8A7F37